MRYAAGMNMAKLEEIPTSPGYDLAASGASKATIFVFMATFCYLVFFSGASPGLIWGAAFFFVGIFAVSLLVSMPFFLLGAKIPSLAVLFSIADGAVTIVLTRAVYLWLFAVSPAGGGEPFVVRCREPIPEFTLGANSNPSEREVTNLCGCVWDNLKGWEKDTARAFSQGRQADVSVVNARAFPSRLGSVIKDCGAMKF